MKFNQSLKVYTSNVYINHGHTLDVGCGYPNPGEPYNKRGNIGIDIKRGYADIIADAHNIPFKDSVFNNVSFHTTLDHLFEPLEALREAHRVTRNTVLISISNSRYWAYAFSDPPPEHLYKWDVITLSNLLQKAGLHPIEYGYEHLHAIRSLREKLFRLVMRIVLRREKFNHFFNDVLIIKATKESRNEEK